MKAILLTQNDNLFLPQAVARCVEQVPGRICCIVVAPAMSTHGGALRGLLRHLRLFGVDGCIQLAWRVARAKLLAAASGCSDGRFHSLAQVGRHFGIDVHRIAKVNDVGFHALIDRYQPDLLVSMSCPQIVGRKVRQRFPAGCVNVHGAPLPRYRGLMPAFWVLRNGESRTAATVHDLAGRLDDGKILVQHPVTIEPSDTWAGLVQKTKQAGADALAEALLQIESGTVVRGPNPDNEATYFSFPTVADRAAFLAAGRRFF